MNQKHARFDGVAPLLPVNGECDISCHRKVPAV
jgi:hypothetical protein